MYRQHHQSQVTVENPKLSNPEISKIIGDKWKHESEDVKENWKKLAEEEKQRHQHQYPNYRYQPRRGTKSQGNWTATSPTDEHGRCPKCHGRSISTPRTPSTPFATSPAGSFFLAASQAQPSLRRLDTPIASRRSSFESPTNALPFAHQLPPVRDVRDAEHHGEPMTSPDLKRRRANGAGSYHAVAGTPGAYTIRPPSELRRTPPEAPTNVLRPYAGGTLLPELASLPRSHSGPMPPPLRPPGSSPWAVDKELISGGSRRHSAFDESLRLPPLQTSIPPPSPSESPALESRHAHTPSTRLNVSPIRDQFARDAAETPNASQPTLKQKMSILSTISQPLPSAGRHGPRGDKRGAFIAVEGPHPATLDRVGRSLERILVAGGDVALKVWTNSDSPAREGKPKAAGATNGTRTPEPKHAGHDDPLASYFDVVLSWRQKAQQIIYHVNGGQGGASSLHASHDGRDSKLMQALSTEACTPPHDERSPSAGPKLPVALVKDGLSLTLSDKFASAAPVSDDYSPLDHWRWTASLWRGTPRPDLVVYVQDNDDAEAAGSSGSVDVHRRTGLIVLKIPQERMLDEAIERRLAFEVLEWMRDAPFQGETPKWWRQDSL